MLTDTASDRHKIAHFLLNTDNYANSVKEMHPFMSCWLSLLIWHVTFEGG